MRDWAYIGRKAAHGSLIALAVVALLIVGLLRTPPGHATLALLVEELTGGQVSVQGLSGNLPDDLHADVVEIRDARGVWLRADNVSLDWSALPAADNHILVHSASAAKVAMLRMPQSEETSEGATPQIDIGALSVRRIEIAQAVMGHAALLQAQGSLHYQSVHQAHADLVIVRLDNSDRYIVKGGIDADVANGTVSVAEGANGILAALIGEPGLRPINIQARAAGDRGANTVAFQLSAGALRASGSGALSLSNRAADVEFSVTAPAMQPDASVGWEALAMRGHIRGGLGAPQVTAKLQATDLKIAGNDLGQVDADVNGSNGLVDLAGTANGVRIAGDHPDVFASAPVFVTARADLKSPSRPVRFSLSHPLMTVKGNIDTAGATKLNADVTIPSLLPFAALQGEDVRGAAALHVAIAQDAKKTGIVFNGRMNTRGASLIARVLGSNATLSLQADLDGSDIVDSKVSVAGAGLNMQGTGSFRKKSLNYSMQLGLPDLSRLAGTLNGSATFTGTVLGPMETAQLHASGTADMASKGFARQRIGVVMQAVGLPNPVSAQLRAQGSLDNAPIAIEAALAGAAASKMRGAKLAARWKSLDANADVKLPKSGPVTGTARIGLKNIADMASFIGTKIAGSLSAAIELKAHGVSTIAVVKARASEVSLQGNKAGVVDVQGAVSDPFTKPSFDLITAVRKFEGNGISGDADAKLTGSLDKLAVTLKSDFRDAAKNPAHIATSAVLDVPKQRVVLQKLNADWQKQTIVLKAPATVDFADGIAVDRLAVSVGGGEVQLSGRLTPKLAASLSAHGIKAQALEAFVPQLSATGTLSADAKLSGTLEAPQGTISVQGRDLRLRDYSANAVAPANLDLQGTLHGNTMNLNASLTAGNSIHLTVTGEAPLRAGKLNLHLGGDADLAMLNPLLAVDGRQAKGAVAIDMNVGGTLAAPRATGSVVLSKGEVRDFARGLSMHDIGATVRADGDVLHVTQFIAHAGHGTIGGTGTIDLAAAGMPADINLTAQDARPIVSDLMTATFSGDAKLSGKLKSTMNLSGKIFVAHGEINLPDRFPPEVAVLDVRRRGEKPPAPPSSASSVALDVAVTTRGQIFVRGHGIDADLGGRIHLTGTTATPFASGGFKMNRGSFAMAGQTLDFTTGEVRFDGTGVRNRLDPTLNFVAETTSGGVTATLTVSGYASAPKIALSSSPQLPQDEILAHLLFQQSVKQLTPLQLAQIAQAIASLGGIGSGFNPLGSLRKTLGLDRLSVGSTSGGAAGSDQQTTVEAGKYVARNIYVGAKQNLSGGTQVQVQVDLTRKLKAQATLSTATNATATKGSAAQDNGSSVGLSYQFEY